MIYKDGKFYVNDEPLNPEHDGFTLLDLCETLCFCPFSLFNIDKYQMGVFKESKRRYQVVLDVLKGNRIETIKLDSTSRYKRRLLKKLLKLFNKIKDVQLVEVKATEPQCNHILLNLFGYNRAYQVSVNLSFDGFSFSFGVDILFGITDTSRVPEYVPISGPFYLAYLDWYTKDSRGSTTDGYGFGCGFGYGLSQLEMGQALERLFDKVGVLDELKAAAAVIGFNEML